LLIFNHVSAECARRCGLQHEHSWKVFAGETTEEANLVAIMQPAHMNIIGKHVRILRPGQNDPFLSVKVRRLSLESKAWQRYFRGIICLCPQDLPPADATLARMLPRRDLEGQGAGPREQACISLSCCEACLLQE
jgi:hypothetical protein